MVNAIYVNKSDAQRKPRYPARYPIPASLAETLFREAANYEMSVNSLIVAAIECGLQTAVRNFISSEPDLRAVA